jgi:hypothetical protein
MPDRLSLRPALLMVALAFGVALVLSALLGGGSSAAQPAAKQSAPRVLTDAPGAEPDLSLEATEAVPALRDPRKRRAPARKKKASARKVVNAAPKVKPAAPVSPMPIATPRYVPPAPRRSTPAPKPKPKPAPTPQGSGEFDNSGE